MLPWVERYRPRSIKDVAHQEEVTATLQKAVSNGAKKGNLPHLLLYGPPGTGKTSLALALCRDLFVDADTVKNRVLELNASDERGIKVVRDKIKTFAQRTVSAVPKKSDGRPSPPPFKIVILDEADAITADAQTALRRTMEAHSRSTRFVLICNYVSRIIAPLASRCAKFRFKPLPSDSMFTRLKHVANEESVSVPDSVLRELISSSGGDLRKAITTLQSAHCIAGPDLPLSSHDVSAAACLVPDEILESFDRETANEKSTHKELRKIVNGIVRDGYSAAELFNRYSALIVQDTDKGVGSMNKLQKAAISLSVASADSALLDGGDEVLQLFKVIGIVNHAVRSGSNVADLRSISHFDSVP